MKTIILLPFFLLSLSASAQTADTLRPTEKYKKVFPGLILGYNYTGFSSGEAGLLFGLTNNSMKQTYAMSMILHGPSVGCQLGSYNDAFRVAPRIAYEYYTSFISGRIGVVDYMDDDIHSFYLSPEAGISMGSFINLFCGANIPISKTKVAEVKVFRLTASVNLLFFYFAKDKTKK